MTALVRSAALGNYAEVARGLGLEPTKMIRNAGLDPAFLSNPDLRIPTAAVIALLEESARKSGCDTLGLRMAESWRMSDFGAISLLLTYQPTLRDALAATTRYRHLLNDSLSLEVEDAGDLVVVREELVGKGAARSRQAIELAIGVIFRMFRALLGPHWKPRRVQFAHSAPRDMGVHRRVFGPNVEFGSGFNGIVCDAVDLDRPNPAGDPAMASYARRFVESLPGAGPTSMAQEVRRSIYVFLPQARASIEHVAHALGVSPRMLQRSLEETGESFSDLLTEARRELAMRYLANPDYSMTQVAHLLGYSFPSSFTRWFVAQFGRSPAGWRDSREGATSRG
ncbi:MAG TPA: AraC family transcriptional regulator [Usitatibacter sp.]|jgi:AraC-like DNA-binding protein|nr:AraC family transcriptional regulator [Usitatibacter sp.]